MRSLYSPGLLLWLDWWPTSNMLKRVSAATTCFPRLIFLKIEKFPWRMRLSVVAVLGSLLPGNARNWKLSSMDWRSSAMLNCTASVVETVSHSSSLVSGDICCHPAGGQVWKLPCSGSLSVDSPVQFRLAGGKSGIPPARSSGKALDTKSLEGVCSTTVCMLLFSGHP